MSQIPEDVRLRLRAFVGEAPATAEELNEALELVRLVYPDFAFAGIGMSRSAAFTGSDGIRHELAGRTHGEILSQAAGWITGRQVRQGRRRGENT